MAACRTLKISSRRYLGSKYKLLPFIQRIVEEECKNIHVMVDIFSGTGVVASAFQGKMTVTNDILYSNYICNLAWLGPETYREEVIRKLVEEYNSLDGNEENYMTENFADTYFSRQDCGKIGHIREDIEAKFKAGQINERERAILITSLLYAMDKIANTCGHYDAYRKGVKFEKSLELLLPLPEKHNNENNKCFNSDANELVREIEADLVYIDPPYNSRQYCDTYHLLENVARWEKPEVEGVARKMDRTALKSDYCTSNAAKAFEDLVDNIQARYILLSYNNMAGKGNERSNAKITDQDILRILGKKGEVQVFSESYKAFSAGKSRISGNEERLFLCKCFEKKKEYIQSPMNYIGGKYKLLPQILPHFPSDMKVLVDLFCGGCNVGINADCKKVIFNDSNSRLIQLYREFKKRDKEEIFNYIEKTISHYCLSKSSEYGYDRYGCASSTGLGSYNKEKYLQLRSDFNSRQQDSPDYYLMMYVLLIYSFNNQLRFNQAGEFNLPVGKRDFNARMEKKLSRFLHRIKNRDYTYVNMDFRRFPLEDMEKGSFIYADPPYLITCATYNERSGWGEQDERELLEFLDRAHKLGLKFALSNVISSKGRKNALLLQWTKQNKDKYKVIHLDYHYANSNYHTKDRAKKADEVLVINY
ncbi:Dam family site-specific DNA-(adenine-N6)-methyltransferase [Lachnoclostridium edouardi]|uniref:Dam family site-specific DNA-(adenine-N6)-methyltransferase n=1 Tax=Lachnoclostridium edouardi TaxID=1926283 RepID=UPI000C7B4C4D|nr:Dam family site-specific DNA-(adenine-N6)-methyltransferase [Lachnoclostridium edouardi]